MNPASRSHARPSGLPAHDQVRVTVAFAGKKNFLGSFLPSETLYQVKVQALHHFKIPLAVAAQYALRYKGGDRSEGVKLSRLGQDELNFTLLAQTTASRFGEALFLR